MKLGQLRSMIEISRTGSLHEAARSLAISQPALSKSIKALELELGAPLLQRHARGVFLTPYGQAVLKRSGAIHREIERLREDVDWLKGEAGGELVIGLTALAGGPLLAAAVAELRKRSPTIQVKLLEMRPQKIIEGLREGMIDVGLVTTFGEIEINGMDSQVVERFPTRLIAGGPRPGNTLTIDELLEEEWIDMEATDEPESFIARFAASLDKPAPARITRCTSVSVCVMMAMSLRAISFISEISLDFYRRYIEGGMLTPLVLDKPLPEMVISLMRDEEKIPSSSSAQFASLLRGLAKRGENLL